jgi:hypothetical protein
VVPKVGIEPTLLSELDSLSEAVGTQPKRLIFRATAHLFTQLATHSEGRGGTQYSRADAKFAMVLVADYLDRVTSD